MNEEEGLNVPILNFKLTPADKVYLPSGNSYNLRSLLCSNYTSSKNDLVLTGSIVLNVIRGEKQYKLPLALVTDSSIEPNIYPRIAEINNLYYFIKPVLVDSYDIKAYFYVCELIWKQFYWLEIYTLLDYMN